MTEKQKRQQSEVPHYVLDYAPLVYLHSQEKYFPSDISAQLSSSNTQPEANFTVVSGASSPLTLDNLNELNSFGTVYLTSKVDITTNPAWLNGVVPDSSGKTENAVPCAIIVNDHGSGNVDAFYMYFYAFNWGGVVLKQQFGDHVGDWEHNMIRFSDGIPTYIWYSQHSNGEAFAYKVVKKSGLRPITYSANGSHANYATTGDHDHTIPNFNLPAGLVEDHTDAGTLWDPMLSAYYYSYTPISSSAGTFAAYDTSTPVNWLYYTGKWGDEQYPDSDKRQKNFLRLGFYKYVSGPTGPEDKQLNRTKVCPDNGVNCILRVVLGP
ncbi:hypothetical protein K432DRAFT_296964 [Lepidopterella palustris CBS 459.81]|uniref:Vacuolar protein sorting-associated protein 62 n=1 Tax=Lepidopterella palustris CBS 459.81 TaxID=1314670 RepID=A0A8E2EBL9_9PEZI|nr:hypothetical protein K432DRAFT_296964 [Lepidopterella palustris CBS 459.81]